MNLDVKAFTDYIGNDNPTVSTKLALYETDIVKQFLKSGWIELAADDSYQVYSWRVYKITPKGLGAIYWSRL